MDDKVQEALVERAQERLAARKVTYGEQNWVYLGRMLERLHTCQEAGRAELSAQELRDEVGLTGNRLTGYLRNLELVGIVEGVGKGRGGIPHASYSLHVSELLSDAPAGPRTPAKVDGLAGELFANGYLKANPEARKKLARELELLSAWLEEHPEPPAVPVHMNERSYDIFNDEKLMADERVRKLIRGIELADERLGICPTKTGFMFQVAPGRRRQPTFLLVENHAAYDTFAHIICDRRRPLELLGERIDGVLHSNGFAVASIGKVEDYIASFGYRDFRLLYWGDIDRSGVRELQSALASARVPLEPFVGLYERCLAHQRERLRKGFPVERAADAGKPCDVEAFACLFTGFDADMVRMVLLGALRIPQEAVCRADIEALLPARPHLPGMRAVGAVARAAGFIRGLTVGR